MDILFSFACGFIRAFITLVSTKFSDLFLNAHSKIISKIVSSAPPGSEIHATITGQQLYIKILTPS